MRSLSGVRFGSRPCENVLEPRKRRSVFSIAFFGQPSPELLVFRLTKSRRTFYAQIERGSFRTASVELAHSRARVGRSGTALRSRWPTRRRIGSRHPSDTLGTCTRESALARDRPHAWFALPRSPHTRARKATLAAGPSAGHPLRYSHR